ncbi:MAG: NBR1-Ig-like domain-containing protein, partial [Anaerolineales bacterium]
MHRIKLPSIFFVLLLAGVLSACGGGSEETSSLILTEAAQIAINGLTQTAAAASPTPTATEVPPTPTEAPTQTPTLEGTPSTAVPTPTQQQSGGSGSPGCLRAEMYYESPQDGAQFDIGASFTKRWSFKNLGTCPWTPGFSVVFIDGDQMDAESSVPFSEFTEINIPPGERVSVEVTMFAPNTQGTYKGYWMLRSDNGTYFGLGPTGKSWFWVEI